jgi:raffinose/stachyose/melibiose transport system permease protein
LEGFPLQVSARKINSIKASATRLSFLLPTIFFFGIAMLIPFFLGIRVAFTDWDGITPLSMANYVGLHNFVSIFHNSDVLRPLRIAIIYALLNTLGNNFFGLLFAVGVTKKYRFNKAHRLIFFMPAALSSVLAAFMWNYIYSNVLPQVMGVENYLSNPSSVVAAVSVITIWGGCGVPMLIYIAGLTSVPSSLYESAVIDGANAFQQFWKITIPLIMQSFTVNITITFTNSLSSAGLFLAATHGGPGGASESMGLYIYNFLFKYNKAGYGQALAYLFLAFIVVLAVLISGIFRKREVEM